MTNKNKKKYYMGHYDVFVSRPGMLVRAYSSVLGKNKDTVARRFKKRFPGSKILVLLPID